MSWFKTLWDKKMLYCPFQEYFTVFIDLGTNDLSPQMNALSHPTSADHCVFNGHHSDSITIPIV